eukprot:CAMPEP_0182887448 /NCGR_PEP_ID=MMETSP0034_2-20130328/20832_1 /TAXON_ID=156128 /ORGANISM="Nephroselmis pyriformis, Strain CCMP717" /LENGTH=142 /DNA_ID=CAMNT_0025020813 /DNA_START=59 /DNA_END=488 /DNA_ORIENTATION=-
MSMTLLSSAADPGASITASPPPLVHQPLPLAGAARDRPLPFADATLAAPHLGAVEYPLVFGDLPQATALIALEHTPAQAHRAPRRERKPVDILVAAFVALGAAASPLALQAPEGGWLLLVSEPPPKRLRPDLEGACGGGLGA